MAKTSDRKRPKPRAPAARKGTKRNTSSTNEATTDEFEREDMGIAPKE